MKKKKEADRQYVQERPGDCSEDLSGFSNFVRMAPEKLNGNPRAHHSKKFQSRYQFEEGSETWDEADLLFDIWLQGTATNLFHMASGSLPTQSGITCRGSRGVMGTPGVMGMWPPE